ncbi:hypothetical protein TNCV_2883481 [Trichonephila clavipes]|nr:hypothetical protein TNCV_2883481 [Trichonephila clavipes]
MWTRNYGALGQTARVCFGVLCANRTRVVKRDFGDLPIRRDEGRVVNTPLEFKRVLFEEGEGGRRRDQKERRTRKSGRENGAEKRTRESGRENGRKEKGESGRERAKPALNGEKGLSPEIGVKKTMNAGSVENGNMN